MVRVIAYLITQAAGTPNCNKPRTPPRMKQQFYSEPHPIETNTEEKEN
jgi:hypothetical protein